MRLGMHLSIGKGLVAALARAEWLGCETLQIFSGNPNAWREVAIPPASAELFRNDERRLRIRPTVLHTPYLLNLATSDDLIYGRSVNALTSALHRATLLDAEYVVTHIGSHGGRGYDDGVRRVQQAVSSALDGSPGECALLLEGSSGAGYTIGSRFEELAEILSGAQRYSTRLGVALDTAHLWGAGYDISSPEAVNRVIGEFDDVVGLTWLRVMHCNDTKVALGSRRDRHWHIGEGNIGVEGFRALVNHGALSGLPGILETPMDEPGRDERNLHVLKSLRSAQD